MINIKRTEKKVPILYISQSRSLFVHIILPYITIKLIKTKIRKVESRFRDAYWIQAEEEEEREELLACKVQPVGTIRGVWL